MKKVDLEAELFIKVLGLKEEKIKRYSEEESDLSLVYLFNDYDEYKNYFAIHGFEKITEEILELCEMKVTSNGTVIALKQLCDSTIKKYREKNHIDDDNKEIKDKSNSFKIKNTLSFYKRMENDLAAQINPSGITRERCIIRNRRYLR